MGLKEALEIYKEFLLREYNKLISESASDRKFSRRAKTVERALTYRRVAEDLTELLKAYP